MFTEREEKKFENIWRRENVEDENCATSLEDDVYIQYRKWEAINDDVMMMKYKTDPILFHGGCMGCNSQFIHDIDRCKGCSYFKADWDKPNLYI